MKEIIYKTGDFLSGPETIKAHGCNAQGVMGSGAAKCVRDRYPGAYKLYADQHKQKSLYLGDVIWYYDHDESTHIANCITQKNFGRDPNVQYVDYSAIKRCMEDLERADAPQGIAMPMIGSGLANGDWEIIKGIIQRSFKYNQPVVYQL